MKHTTHNSKILQCISLLIVTALLAFPAHALVITSATLTGPDCIECGKEGEITLTLKGTGRLGDSFFYSVYDLDTSFTIPDDQPSGDSNLDDLLQDEIVILVPANGIGNWEFTTKFILDCIDGVIKGINGSSGEASAEVYVILEDRFGFDLITTAHINVDCCDKTYDVPEPGTLSLIIFAILGLVIGRRTQAVST